MTDAAEHRRDRAREAAAGLEYLAGLARGNDYADEMKIFNAETDVEIALRDYADGGGPDA